MAKALAVVAGLLAAVALGVVVVAHPFRNSASIDDTARAMCGGKQSNQVCIRLVSEKLRNHSMPRP